MQAQVDALWECLREYWVPLPATGPFADIAPIYWVSTAGHVVWVAPAAPPGKRFGVKAFRLKRAEKRSKKQARYRTNLKLAGRAGYRTVYVHHIVAHAFDVGGFGGMVCHLNGYALDNRPENLSWGTASENLQDAWQHGVRGRADYDDTGLEYVPGPDTPF